MLTIALGHCKESPVLLGTQLVQAHQTRDPVLTARHEVFELVIDA